MDDRELAQDVESIYRAYASFVLNVAYRMVESREDAEEIVQEVFINVHQKLGEFMYKSTIKTWIYRITVNQSINFLNKRKSTQRGRVYDEAVFEQAAGPNTVAQDMDQQDSQQRMTRLLSVLNPDEKACIILRSIEGLSYEEIAESLDVNLNTVRTRIKRAREKMMAISKEVIADEV